MITDSYPAIELDTGLVEESVLRAVDGAGAEERRRFRAERNAIYSLPDPDEREARFRGLHARWFERLGLGRRLRDLLGEQASDAVSAPGPRRCIVLRAAGVKQEGADLHEAEQGPVLAVRLRASSLLDLDAAVPLLRRELLHVSDMLDPEFGYTRALPGEGLDPVRDRQARDRYRVMWDASVDGRLVSRGLLPPEARAPRRVELACQFPSLNGAEIEALFTRLFEGPRPRHDELCALAAAPAGSPRCSVCGFPTRRMHPEPAGLDDAVARAIQADYPQWRREEGLCLQCSDLYAARTLVGR